MPSPGIHGHGTTLSGGTAGAIGFMRECSIEGQETDDLDISTMDSEDKWREYTSGMKEPGTLSLTLVYQKDQLETIYTNFGIVQEWTITLPDGSTAVGTGYIRSLETPINFEEEITHSMEIKWASPVVFVAA